MRNPNQAQEDDDSWEVRAFEEDTQNIMGATWPPCSYTCTFCRREFRSAQALGGHMNVHRQDRARLNQTPPTVPKFLSSHSSTSISPSTFITPTQELCLLYKLPNPNPVLASTIINGCPDVENSPCTFLSISQHQHNQCHHQHPRSASREINSSHIYSGPEAKPANYSTGNSSRELSSEEVDLELRLGHRSTSVSSSSSK